VAGRPSKYFTHVQPYLDVIKAWCRNGATDLFIAGKLNIGMSTFMEYKKQFPELVEALRTNKEFADLEVENALHKLATGQMVEETRETTNSDVIGAAEKNKKQQPSKVARGKHTTIIRKYIKPDFRAACKWLGSRQPERWAKDAANREDANGEQLTALYEAMTPAEREKLLHDMEVEGDE